MRAFSFLLLFLILNTGAKAQDSLGLINDSLGLVNNDTNTADTNVSMLPAPERAAVLLEEDTLWLIQSNSSQFSAAERALLINRRLSQMLDEENYLSDSLQVDTNNGIHITYAGRQLMDVYPGDCDTNYQSPYLLALKLRDDIDSGLQEQRANINLKEILTQIGLAVLTLLIATIIIRYVNRFFKFLALRIHRLKDFFAEGLKIRNYQLFDRDQMIRILLIAVNLLRILILIIIFYITLPVLLQFFPWTEGIARTLFAIILDPAKLIIRQFVDFIPNLFSILIIFFIFHYIIQAVKYFSREIKTQKLKIPGFYPEWATTTSGIAIFFLYVFMFIIIWDYLPASDSDVFKGVSVFLGLLVSLGSSTAIANIVSGLVITYMRPYKVGDRVSIGQVTGDVMEKNMLVTRLKTIKNEVITVPNSTILAGSSVNYSQSSDRSEGLILHTTVTIGYDVPWLKVREMLVEAAIKTPMVEEHPQPFVLQTSLDDFYVSYQINAYTKAPSKQAQIYSDLHALIQDVFARNGVEIMSPHYRAERDGPSTIPPVNGGAKNETS